MDKVFTDNQIIDPISPLCFRLATVHGARLFCFDRPRENDATIVCWHVGFDDGERCTHVNPFNAIWRIGVVRISCACDAVVLDAFACMYGPEGDGTRLQFANNARQRDQHNMRMANGQIVQRRKNKRKRNQTSRSPVLPHDMYGLATLNVNAANGWLTRRTLCYTN